MPKSDSPAEPLPARTTDAVALALYEALREANPNAWVSGVPGDLTSIEGSFDLRRVARRLIRRLGKQLS